jgi:adenine/guanine phosphoribosyltransferase-like PRPP-binding protein
MCERWLVLCENEGLASRVTRIIGWSNKNVRSGGWDLLEAGCSLSAGVEGEGALSQLSDLSVVLVIGFKEEWLRAALAVVNRCEAGAKIIVATFESRVAVVQSSLVRVDSTVVVPSVAATVGKITSQERVYRAQDSDSPSETLIDDVIDSIIAPDNRAESLDLAHEDPRQSSQIRMPGCEFLGPRESIDSRLNRQSNCGLDLIYRCGPEEKYNGRTLASLRFEMGRNLAKQLPQEIKDQIDIISPVPQTGRYYAQGLAKELGKPYLELISKETNSGRSFDISDSTERRKFLVKKLELVMEVQASSTIALVDEAIFTGSTLRAATDLFDGMDVSIFIMIPTPLSRSRCPYGMMPDRPLLTEYVDESALPSYFNVNRVTFMNSQIFERDFTRHNSVCAQCFFDAGVLL